MTKTAAPRRWVLTAAATLLACVAPLLAACGSDSSAPGGEASETKKLGFLVLTVDPWVSVAIDKVEKDGKAAGFDVNTIVGEGDVATMTAAMYQFVVDDVDAILFMAPDPDSLVPSVIKADAAGIPVFTFSLGISDAAPVTAHIGADDVSIGRVQGELIAESIGGAGTVALMSGILGTGPQLGRSEGVKEALAEYPDIEIVEQQPNDWAEDKTIALTQDWLSKYPKGELDAIASQGPEIAAGARLAHSDGRDEIKFVACDYPEDVREAIESGTVFGTVDQDPALMGEEAVKAIATVVDGGAVEDTILIDTPMVTADNAADIPAAY